MLLSQVRAQRSSTILDKSNIILNELIQSDFDYLNIGNFIENNDEWYMFADSLKNLDLDEYSLEDTIYSYYYDVLLPGKKEELETYLYDEVVEYLENNLDEFNHLIEQLDEWNGYLQDDRWLDMSWLDDEALLGGYTPFELIDIGMKSQGDFDLNDDFFRFTIYGTLESTGEKDYNDYLGNYFVDDVLANYQHLDISTSLDALLTDLEKLQEVE